MRSDRRRLVRVAAAVGAAALVSVLAVAPASGAPTLATAASDRTAPPPTASAGDAAPVASIATGGNDDSCLVAGGVASCWGSNRVGQLGNGTFHHASTPTPVTTAGTPLAGTTVAQVAVGEGVACALTTTGSVSCWGGDGLSRTGNAASPDRAPLPVAVATNGPLQGKTVTQIAAKRWSVCALTADSTIACWGYNSVGQLGNGTTTDSAVPVAVTLAGSPLAGKTIASIDVGYAHSCALATDGTIGCWGYNGDGQLGDGTTTSSSVPVAVKKAGTALEGKTPVEVSAGHQHTCARSSDGTVACWGSAAGGALGRGNLANSLTAVPVGTTTALAGKSVADVEAGAYFTCVRTTDGLPICWGTGNFGQQGNGLMTGEGDPKVVSVAGTPLEGRAVNDLAVGISHTCAVSVGVVACWGQNTYGQIGNGVSGVALVPAPAVNGALTGVTVDQVAGGPLNGCARTSAGVACWGENTDNVVAFPGLVDRRSPELLGVGGSPLSGSPAVDLAVGGQHACAVSANGQITCWGDNGSKQLGRSGFFGNAAAVATTGSALAGKTAVRIVAGAASSCALTTDGIVACWGGNAAGQLGNGTTTGTFVATAITTAGTPLAGKTVVDIAYGENQGCALASDSTLACWGVNTAGALGNGTTTNSLVPVAVTRAGTPLAGKTIVDIEGGASGFCAVTSDGAVACWGGGAGGSLGRNSTADSSVPVAPTTTGTALAGKSIAQATTGEDQRCLRTTDGTVTCAGDTLTNGGGRNADVGAQQLHQAITTAGTPLAGKTVKQIASMGTGTCALTTDSVVSCWGPNWEGELGNGTQSFETKPAGVVGFDDTTIEATVPGAPTIGVASAGNGQATVAWTPPADDGGAPVSGYVITPSIGATAQAPIVIAGTATTKVVTGLANGTTYTFKVAAQNAIGTGAASAASNAVTPRAPFHPFASWTALVQRVSLDLTGTALTGSELTTWVADLTNGSKTKGDLVAALRAGVDNTTKVDPAVRLYRALLGRAPDASGLKFWIGRRRSGAWTLNRMASGFSDSPEFQRKYGSLTNRQFVTQIYTDVLGRTADPAGVDFWTKQLDTKRRSRGGVMVGFSESNEYKRKQVENTDLAVNYICLLGRAPTSAETTDWVSRQKGGTTQADLAEELLDSAAYATHILG